MLKAKAISLKLLQRERAKKETEEREADEEEAILRSVKDESKKLAAEELLKKQIDAALKASAEEIKLQVRKEVREEVVQEVVVRSQTGRQQLGSPLGVYLLTPGQGHARGVATT